MVMMVLLGMVLSQAVFPGLRLVPLPDAEEATNTTHVAEGSGKDE
jgi:hypothetical protein